MNDKMKKLADNGLLINEEGGKYILQKTSTTASPAHTFGDYELYRSFDTYDEAVACALCVLGEENSGCEFSVHARFDRGLGWETKKLPGVRASTVAAAKKSGWEQAIQYFATHEDLKEAKVSEVIVRPGSLE